jgi:hypothetical protein
MSIKESKVWDMAMDESAGEGLPDVKKVAGLLCCYMTH